MEFNKTVSNPMLIGTIELLKAEDTPEHWNMFVEELMKGSYISPANVEPAPVKDAEGKLTLVPGSKIQLPMLTSSDGCRFFMAFTDTAEYEKWPNEDPNYFNFALSLDDYANMILRRDPKGGLCPALGIVINPYGANMIVPREMLAGIMNAKRTNQTTAARNDGFR